MTLPDPRIPAAIRTAKRLDNIRLVSVADAEQYLGPLPEALAERPASPAHITGDAIVYQMRLDRDRFAKASAAGRKAQLAKADV